MYIQMGKDRSFILRLTEEEFARLGERSGGNRSKYLRDYINSDVYTKEKTVYTKSQKQVTPNTTYEISEKIPDGVEYFKEAERMLIPGMQRASEGTNFFDVANVEKMALIANLRKKSEEVMARKPLVRESSGSAVEHSEAWAEMETIRQITEQFCFENDIGDEGLLSKMQKEWISKEKTGLLERYNDRVAALPIKSDGTLDKRIKDDVIPFVKGFQGSMFKVSGEKKTKKWKKKEAE